MIQGWGEIAQVCRTGGALVIHFEYDGASLMLFKVFDEDGRRLECCPRDSGRSSGSGDDQACRPPFQQLLQWQRTYRRVQRVFQTLPDPGDE